MLRIQNPSIWLWCKTIWVPEEWSASSLWAESSLKGMASPHKFNSRVCYGIMRARSWDKCSFSHKWIYMTYELWDSVHFSIRTENLSTRNKTIHLHLRSNRHWWGGCLATCFYLYYTVPQYNWIYNWNCHVTEWYNWI